MKTTFKFSRTQSGILCAIALLVLIAFSLATCDSGLGGGGGTDSLLNGTWSDGNETMKFNNGNFENEITGTPSVKGTYTTNGSSLICTPTHYYGKTLIDVGFRYLNIIQNRWYSMAELRALGFPEDELANSFSPVTSIYSVSGNTLYITGGGKTIVYYGR